MNLKSATKIKTSTLHSPSHDIHKTTHSKLPDNNKLLNK